MHTRTHTHILRPLVRDVAATCRQCRRSDYLRRDRNCEDVTETSLRLVGDIMETSPRLVGDIMETSPRLVGDIMETSPRLVGDIMETSPRLVGDIMETSPRLVGDIMETSPRLVGDIMETSPRLVGDIMETSPRLPDTTLLPSVPETSRRCPPDESASNIWFHKSPEIPLSVKSLSNRQVER